ncbi:MAG: LTA synthase family protein [Rhodanobacter sp.]
MTTEKTPSRGGNLGQESRCTHSGKQGSATSTRPSSTRPTGVWLLAQLSIFALAWIAAIGIAPYVDLTSELPLRVANALPVALLAVTASVITGRPLFGLALTCGSYALLIYADHLKLTVLHAHVTFADLRVIPMLAADPSLVAGFISKSIWKPLLILLLAIALLFIAWMGIRVRGSLVARAIFFLGCLALLRWAVLPANGIMPTHPDWVVFQQADESPNFGVLANLIYGWRSATKAIAPGDELSRERLLANPAVAAARGELKEPATITPDIVIVQSESLFDPSVICGTPDKSVLPFITASEHGSLIVPVFGGRTLQTEFETLSGVPVSAFSNADFAYLNLVKGSLDALPAHLDKLGYRTIAIHPNDRNFWRRNYAIPALGFQNFIDITAFSGIDVNEGGRVTDAALTSAALTELDADSGPAFIFLITMANHGPWGGKGKSELEDYTARASLADAAWQQLIDGLAKRNRPALAILYGDHLPGLTETYKSRCFKDGRPPQEHMPPVAVWSNMPGKLRPPPKASFLTPGWVLDSARLPRSEIYAINGAVGLVAERNGEKALANIETDYAAVTDDWMGENTRSVRFLPLLSDEAIGKELRKMLTEGRLGPWVPQDLMMNRLTGEGSVIGLQLDGKVVSMTFRPYPGDPQCKTTDPIIVNVDGRDVGRIDGGPLATLATIDTSGAKQLTLTRSQGDNGPRCAVTMLRVVQMEERDNIANKKPH